MRPKSKFLTFVLALFPGAGHMYLGFMKQGVELMVMFLALCMLASIMGIGLGVFIPLFIAYSIFDALKKRNYNVPPNDTSDLDVFYWFGFKAPATKKNLKRRKVLAFVIMLIGAYLIVDGIIFSGLRQLAWYWDENGIFYDIQVYLRVLIVAGLLIFGGVKLLKHVDNIDPEEIPEDTEEKIPVYYQNPAASQPYQNPGYPNRPVPPRAAGPYTQTPPYGANVPPRYPAAGYQRPFAGQSHGQPGVPAGSGATAGVYVPGAFTGAGTAAAASPAMRPPFTGAAPAPGTPGRPVTGKGKVDIDAIIREAAGKQKPPAAKQVEQIAEQATPEKPPSAAADVLPDDATMTKVVPAADGEMADSTVSQADEALFADAPETADEAEPDTNMDDGENYADDAAAMPQTADQPPVLPTVKEVSSQEKLKEILEGKGGGR